MSVFCIGISHHTATVEARERYVGAGPEREWRNALGCDEVLVLATCNRVEVYGVAERQIATAEIIQFLQKCEPAEIARGDTFYRFDGDACARHLFRVVAGLDSMMIGETEILGQVKKAYASARETGNAGSLLHRLFQRAFRVAKQVRSNTDITRGAVSVGSVAVELAEKIFGDLSERRVLVLGAGETSERTARSLSSRGVTDIRVSNRSRERADALAELVGGRGIAFEDWPAQCSEVDILISSTSAEEPLLTASMLAPIIRERRDRPLFIIDIAVPRDVDPNVNEMEGVYLYDIDSLQSIADQSLAMRRQQVAAADEIIAEHVSDFSIRFGGGQRGAAPEANPNVIEQRAVRASQ
jgi:glutamyl-tRNA reductase